MRTSPVRPRRDLQPLFDPRALAIIGASNDDSKWGYALADRALTSEARRTVHLVNRRGGTVLGRPVLRSLHELGPDAGVDLVALCVPAGSFLSALDDALAAGARAVVAITAGLAESSADGASVQAEAVARVRAAGAVMVGPNCAGVEDTSTGLQLSSEVLVPGHVAVLSQSGNMLIDVQDRLRTAGLGISRFVSLGNQGDLTVVDVMESCLRHDATHSVAVYAEDVVDGRGFVTVARALAAAGKPVVLLSPGRTDAGTRGAASHTGSLTTSARVVDAACAAAGVLRAESPEHLVDLVAGLDSPRRSTGRRVAVLTDGGGHGAVAADALGAAGLHTPVLSPVLRARLTDLLWSQSAVANPVDLAGMGERDPLSYLRATSVLLESDEVDGVLLTGYFGGYSLLPTSLAGRELTAVADLASRVTGQTKPVVVHTVYPDSPSSMVLRGAGVPVHRDAGRAAAVLAGCCRPVPATRTDDIALPPSAALLTSTDYGTVRDMLAGAGLPFPASATVSDEAGLRAVLPDLLAPGPVVLKALGLLHKSDAGGVLLDLRDEAETVAAYRDLMARLAPPGVSVEQQAERSAGVEVIVGCRRDPCFGPVLMVGLGGVFTEVLDDVAVALAPVSVATASELLLSLRGAPLLTGARGRPPVDLHALATLAATLSKVAAEHPELCELEINPVLATPRGALGLDARAVVQPPARPAD
jgi:acyl-CoA synthetase (NDP forming)